MTLPLKTLALLVLGTMLAGSSSKCSESDNRENRDVERAQVQFVTNQPPPIFDWSLERHLMVQLYQARNNAVVTYSYVLSPYTGKIIWGCPSMGYPIPYTTQLTNPQKYAYTGTTLPQPEPNGMYTGTTTATFVMCLDQGTGLVAPHYVEDEVTAFPWPMRNGQTGLERVPGSAAGVKLNPKR